MLKLCLKFPVTAEKAITEAKARDGYSPSNAAALGKVSLCCLLKCHIQVREAELPGMWILAPGLLSAPRLHFPIRTPTEPGESHLQAKLASDGGRATARLPLMQTQVGEGKPRASAQKQPAQSL